MGSVRSLVALTRIVSPAGHSGRLPSPPLISLARAVDAITIIVAKSRQNHPGHQNHCQAIVSTAPQLVAHECSTVRGDVMHVAKTRGDFAIFDYAGKNGAAFCISFLVVSGRNSSVWPLSGQHWSRWAYRRRTEMVHSLSSCCHTGSCNPSGAYRWADYQIGRNLASTIVYIAHLIHLSDVYSYLLGGDGEGQHKNRCAHINK